MDIALRLLNALLMIALPIAVWMRLTRAGRDDWGLIGAGALTFIASQVLHLPFNHYVLSGFLERFNLQPSSGWNLALWALLLGLSAGLFEELSRLLVFWRWRPSRKNRRSALALGAGHGGIEAVLVGIISLLTLYSMVTYRNADLSSLVSPAELPLAAAQVSAYWGAPWHLVLLGALERGLALCLHLALSVLVFQTLRRRQLRWVLAAIAWHSAANAVAVFANLTWGPYAAEGLLVGFALASVAIIVRLKDPSSPAAQPLEAPVPLIRSEIKLDLDRLDDSRFLD